jgi:hypothetical protein
MCACGIFVESSLRKRDCSTQKVVEKGKQAEEDQPPHVDSLVVSFDIATKELAYC